jgi:FAD/FMN-containing dehydrogenase
MAELDGHIEANRHFEFFWYPATDLAHMKALNPTSAPPNALPDRDGERIDYSHRIFPSVRNNKFNECEYAIPAERGPACFRDIRELMRTKHTGITWPVEYRTVKADDIYLSPAYGRETVTLSIHQANTLPHAEFFADAEVIFRRHGGRPHWGKMHSLTARELQPLYPQWDAFQAVRRQFDPVGRFLNSHLEKLFE